MSDYVSFHSGQNIDLAVTKSLNGTAGIQGVKVLGTDVPIDSSNKANINWSNFVMYSTKFFPTICGITANGETGTTYDPTCSYITNNGYVSRFGNFCYISIFIKCRISSVYSGANTYAIVPITYFDIRGFEPAPIDGVEFALTVGEISVFNGGGTMPLIDSKGVTAHINPRKKYIRLERDNGASLIRLGTVLSAGSSDNAFTVSVSGIIPVVSSL